MATSMRVLVAALCIAAAVVLAPMWVSLLLAAWCADLLRSPARRLEVVLGGRRRAAAAVIVIVVVGALLPISGMVAALVSEVRELLDQVRAALEGQGSLAGALLGADKGNTHPGVRDWANLAGRYGANAWGALSAIARASATATVNVLVFVAASYKFTVDGERIYGWLLNNAPIPQEAFARLARAFRETGRGLIVAGGGTAVIQGTVATIAYVAIGIPRALLLGPLTAVCSLVPLIGTGLVWIPLAIELGATGQYTRSGLIIAVGAGIHSLIDNFIRPLLARYGRLTLPTFFVLLSMIGGIAVFGAAGALLGPLIVRLCVESLAIVTETRRAMVPTQVDATAGGDQRSSERVEPSASRGNREVRSSA
jgi:predicted PurR-regulated permease PerM